MVETTTAVLDSLFQKNTISLAGSTLKNGNKNMSYHVQQNTQQRSLGIFIVITFHVLLIWGLANGLGSFVKKVFVPEPITLTPNQEKVVPPTPIDPQEVIIKSPTITTTNNTTPITFDDPIIEGTGDIGGGIIERATTSVTKPRLIRATKPDYPIAASRLGEEGATGLRFLVNTDGRITDVELVTSSGSSRLDEAAIKHAKRNWVFTPCMEGDKAVACWHQTKMVWKLEDARR